MTTGTMPLPHLQNENISRAPWGCVKANYNLNAVLQEGAELKGLANGSNWHVKKALIRRQS